ncbi:related to VPS41-required for the vacuolar assembly [Claviceps purpurea 20.1]|uniref:Related to VPS41-required for the vacuolar assembly n=1 Tax=Claviceps purpurea (strain 20.1) TaxID=1111077 RepID=M1W595_CLAP2|nr:related to VPS41-required for the vacuolar assembly [Claviceps purpurea 20.1]
MTDESERSADDNDHPPQLEHDSPTDGVKTSASDESNTAASGPVVEHQDDSTQAAAQDVADEDEEEDEDEGEGDEDDPGDEDIDDDDDEDEDEDDDDEEEEEDEEPRFKYARLTQNMSGLYRNGDATSAFIVGGNKMIIGTHNGNIHVVQLPTLLPLRVYHAHSASVTSVSTSPFPPPLSNEQLESTTQPQKSQAQTSLRPDASPARSSRRRKEQTQLPRTPSNDIYIATSSMDGNVCVQSLLDAKDVHLRNFARPVQAVSLSPEYKTDRTYLSGGLAGQLILTVGGGQGRSTSTTTGTAVAAASGWLGSIGLGNSSGKDTVLHSGEGTISSIKWSLSGKYVAWLNEYGIKFMRSNLHLDSTHSEGAWQRIGHYDRPHTEEWETMASVWKGRVEWIDEKAIESDETKPPGHDTLNATESMSKKTMERLIVGWGGTIWIIHVHHGAPSIGRLSYDRPVGRDKPFGRAEVAKILRMDCIIAGLSLYTQSTLLVLAFCPEENDEDEDVKVPEHKSELSSGSIGSEPPGGIRRRHNNPPPELRLIDLESEMEIDKDRLGVSRFERLGAADYHLGVLPAHSAATVVASRGALETLAGLGNDVWNVAINPKSLFGSAASIRSRDSGEDYASVPRTASTAGTLRGLGKQASQVPIHPSLTKPGIKIFIHSPYDCILGTKRDLADHLAWLVEHEQYQQAWELVDENPDIVATAPDKSSDMMQPVAPKRPPIPDYFFDGDSMADSAQENLYSYSAKEKRRIGESWVQQLVENNDWRTAGEVCGKVLSTPDRWEKWVWTFAGAKHFDEITPHIPSEPLQPPLPTTIYEVVLGHYIQTDKPRFKELLERWPVELFDVRTITTALENQLNFRDVQQDSVEDGEKGRDWLIVMQSLARLYEAGGRFRDALKSYIKLHDADSAFRLIRERHLAEAVADDIPSFISLRVPPSRLSSVDEADLAEATSEAITLLVDEAQHGLVRPDVVVEQLRSKKLYLYLYFYLKGLWKGQGIREHSSENMDRLVMDSQSLVDGYADLAVHLFAMHDQSTLMEFLKSSTSYTFEKAVQECEAHSYYDELVFLYSKTGQMKRALYLIIDRLRNVQKAIEFAKEQDDPDLWNNLLDYSMDKPNFIRALLEQVGTAINPITLVRRIPEGLEIQGLREGLTHMMKEHELQHSISSGVAKVLRSELAAAQNDLRAGQQKGIKFQVAQPGGEKASMAARKESIVKEKESRQASVVDDHQNEHRTPQPGSCAGCHEVFTEYEMETIIGFGCGHAFHVSHLLERGHRSRKSDVDLGGESGGHTRYSVGMKVMRARLLRDKVGTGCPVCS